MNSILSPAVTLMKKLKYPHKFALIGVIFLLPISVMLFLLISDMKDKIDFKEKEKLGIEYTLHLKNLVADIQQHRGMTNAYLSGDESFKEELAMKKSQIELKIEQLDVIDKKLGTELLTDNKWKEIKDMWLQFHPPARSGPAGCSCAGGRASDRPPARAAARSARRRAPGRCCSAGRAAAGRRTRSSPL